MKILHTSDLHLGHTLYSYDRTVEQTGCLAQIENIIKEQKPDAYVISGDIYHTTSPQTSAQEMFMHHLMTVHDIDPSMKVIVTAGNHDSNKIEITDPLWNLVGVSIVASIKRNILQGEDSDEFHRQLFERHIFPIVRDGSTVGYIVAIPHCYPGNFPAVKAGLPREERMKEFIALLLGEVEKRNKNGLPVVVMAHTAVNRISGEKPDAVGQDLDIIGGIDMVNADVFGTGYDYIALGHIHNPQNISDRIRYSGSPLPVSFDEDFHHSVSIVTIGAHGDTPEVETIDIDNAMDPEKACYVRLNVTDDGTIPVEAKDKAAKVPEQCHLKAKFCLINRVKKVNDQDINSSGKINISTAELGKMGPYSVAELYLKETGQEGIDENILALLKETIDEVMNPEKHD